MSRSQVIALLLAVLVGGARAEEGTDGTDQPVELGTLEITGSRIRRVDYESAQPVVTITRADIERSGQLSLGEFLQSLSIATQAKNTAINKGGTGQTEIGLRHLGSSRVLVLVNGRRWVNGLDPLSSSAVDLNTIPLPVVDRIEVLKDGASAVYGTDAVAGVINVITRKDYVGTELRAQFGLYPGDGDGQATGVNVSWGGALGATSVFGDVSYARQDPVWARDRELTREPVYGAGDRFGSPFTPQGLFFFVPGPTVTIPCSRGSIPIYRHRSPVAAAGASVINGAFAQVFCSLTLKPGQDGTQQSDFDDTAAFAGSYNEQALAYLQTPSERGALFGALRHTLGAGVEVEGELLYNLRRSRQQLPPTVLVFGDTSHGAGDTLAQTYAAADSRYNPFDQDIGRDASGVVMNALGEPGVGSGLIARRLEEAGPTIFHQDVATWRVGGGLRGGLDAFARPLTWNFGVIVAEGANRGHDEGVVNAQHLQRAVGPAAACAADPECVEVNVFGGQGVDGRGSITPGMLDYLLQPATNRQRQALRDVHLWFAQPFFDLPAGPLQTAYGLEYRREYFEDWPDPLEQSGAGYGPPAEPTRGGYDVREGYAEFRIPLLHDRGWAEALELSLAGRYSKYTSFGGDDNYTAGLRWKPFADLLLRATWSSTFRAPSVSDLYLGAHFQGVGFAELCYPQNRSADPIVARNCDEDGVHPVFSFTPANFMVSGNPDLSPERGRNLSAGFVYSPGFLPDAALHVDWYRIALDDAIVPLGADLIVHECYATEQRSFCSRVRRGNDGYIREVRASVFNVPHTLIEGVDLAFDQRLGAGAWGDVRLQADATYLARARLNFSGADTAEIKPEAPTLRVLDIPGQRFFGFALPRWKAHASLQWARDRWQASWTARYIHHQSEPCARDLTFDFDRLTSYAELGLCSAPNQPRPWDPNSPDFDPENLDEAPDYSRNKVRHMIYHGVQVGFRLSAWDFALGVNNLFDRDPPASYSYPGGSFDPTTYDVPGRVAYLRIGRRW